jgi:hypothetical protein
MRTPAIVGIALLLAGCGELPFGSGPAPPARAIAGVELTAQPQTAAPGGTVALSLRNGLGAPLGYNLCFGGVEQRRAGLWVPALTPVKACPEAYDALAAGETVGGETALHPALPAGEYRYATRVRVPPGEWSPQLVRSNSFTIPHADD